MLSRVFNGHFELLKGASGALLDGAQAQCQSYKFCYNIRFPNEDAARAFFSWGKDTSSAVHLAWRDPKNGQDMPLRVGYDQPLHVRRKSYALGKCWELMRALFNEHGKWKDSYRLGSNPHTGTLHLTCTEIEEIYDLVQLSPGSDMGGGQDAFTIAVMEDAKQFELPEAVLNSFPELVQSKLNKKPN